MGANVGIGSGTSVRTAVGTVVGAPAGTGNADGRAVCGACSPCDGASADDAKTEALSVVIAATVEDGEPTVVSPELEQAANRATRNTGTRIREKYMAVPRFSRKLGQSGSHEPQIARLKPAGPKQSPLPGA
jgi:hypothetical protein